MKIKEWDGSGFPPVGTVCEYLKHAKYRTTWIKVKVVFIGNNLIVFEHGANGNEFSEQITEVSFRPIKTPGAEERRLAVDEMMGFVGHSSTYKDAMSVLYDAGYRKTEAAVFKEYTLQEVIGDAVLSDWARWVAVDSDGRVWEHGGEPYIDNESVEWINIKGGLKLINRVVPPLNFKNCIWEVNK